MSAQYNFRIHVGNDVQIFTEEELGAFAAIVGLDRVAPGRYSWLFAMQLFLHAQVDDVDPSMIVAELRALEGGPQTVGTKPAKAFAKDPLKGLWHKHFFSAHFVGHNLLNQLAGGKLKALVDKVLDPKNHLSSRRSLSTSFLTRSSPELSREERPKASSPESGSFLRSMATRITTCACPRTTLEIRLFTTRSSQPAFTSFRFCGRHPEGVGCSIRRFTRRRRG